MQLGAGVAIDRLATLSAETGATVLETLRGIQAGLVSRWAINLEAGADAHVANLAGKLHQNLELQAKISRELNPGPLSQVLIQNNFAGGAHAERLSDLARELTAFARAHPELRHELAPIVRRCLGSPEGPQPAVAAIEHEVADAAA